jgi:predicted membrane protein
MNEQPTNRTAIIGILLILAGALIFFDIFNVFSFPFKYYIFSWKTLLIALGIIALITKHNKTVGVVLIALGLVFWSPYIFHYHYSFSNLFWPLIFIGIGTILIFNRRTTCPGRICGERSTDENVDNDFFEDLAVFGGGTRNVVSKNLKGGQITAIFGGSDIVLKEAQPAPNCIIDVFILFGGTKFIVPDDWVVKSDVVSIFGGFDDKRSINPQQIDSNKIINIKGLVLFGGGEIKNY